MEFISNNNLGFGSYFSLFDSEGLLRDNHIKPGYLFHQDLTIDVPSNKKRVIYLNVKGIDTDSVKSTNNNSEYDLNAEIILIWIHLPTPAQSVEHTSDKIFYNQHFSGLDLINKIIIYNGTEIYKEYSRQTYRLELQHLLGSEFNNFHEKYLDLTKRHSYQDTILNFNNSKIEPETLHFPIFFDPHLKPSLVADLKNQQKNSKLKNNNFKIEIVFNEISKIYTKSNRVKLNEINLNLSRATIVAKCFNDLPIAENEEDNEVQIQTESVFHNTGAVITNLVSDQVRNNGFEVKLGNIDLLTSNIFFAIDDETFVESKFFYGKTIKESIKCYINSCFKLLADTETCVNLSSLDMSDKSLKGWSAFRIDSNHIILRYTNKFDPKERRYETMLISKKIPFEDMNNIYIDLNVSLVLNLYWFKKIVLDFDYYQKYSYELTSDKFNNGIKVLNSQFMYTPSRLENDNETNNKQQVNLNPVVFVGVNNFCFNYNIVTQNNSYLTSKHFDVYFSLPVNSEKPSFFAKLDFVIIDYCDYQWMDLDRKYPWKINSISVLKKSDTSFLVKFEENTISTMSLNQPFDMQMLTITSPGLQGYCNLNNYDLIVEFNENEFFEIKQRKHIKMECIVSNYKFFKYHKRKYHKLKLDSILSLSESGHFHELLREENECKKKFKYN